MPITVRPARRPIVTFDLDVEEHRVVTDALRAHRRGHLDSEQLAALDAYNAGEPVDAPEALRSAVVALGADSARDAARLAGRHGDAS